VEFLSFSSLKCYVEKCDGKSLHLKNIETIIFSDNEILLFSTNFDETLVKIRLILFFYMIVIFSSTKFSTSPSILSPMFS